MNLASSHGSWLTSQPGPPRAMGGYSPHTPSCCCLKQGVIAVIWGRTESGEGEGAGAALMPLQATLQPP